MNDKVLDQFQATFGPGCISSGEEDCNRAPRVVPSLEQRTLNSPRPPRIYTLEQALDHLGIAYSYQRQPNTHQISFARFITGDVEMVSTAVDAQSSPSSPSTDSTLSASSTRSREDMSLVDLQRSAGRSKRQVRHHCIQIEANLLVTLTVRGNPGDDHFLGALGTFLRRFRSRYPKGQYVLVLERHQKGNLHAHMALHGFYNYNVLRRLWHWALTGKNDVVRGSLSPGNIDGKAPPRGREWKPVDLAHYIAKYISKESHLTDGTIGKKRYWASKGIVPPKKAVVYVPFSFHHNVVLAQVVQLLTGARPRRMREFNLGWLSGVYVST